MGFGSNSGIVNQLETPAFYAAVFAQRPAFGYTGRMFISTDTFEFYRDTGSAWVLIGGPGAGTITGSGTAGKIAKFTAAGVIGDSVITESGGNLSIGAATFTAGTFIGALTGNASTATALQNARTIGGVSFNGTANITVASATGGFTVTGGDLAVGSGSGSVGVRINAANPIVEFFQAAVSKAYIQWNAVSGYLNIDSTRINFTGGNIAINNFAAPLCALCINGGLHVGGQSDAGDKNILADGIITATLGFIGALTGNASTATALQNARTIGGVSFNGTANITVASATGGFTVSGGSLVAEAAAFSGAVTVPDDAYAPGWNGSLQVPTKNAVYDAIQSGTFTPTLTDGSNVASSSLACDIIYQRVGNRVSGSFSVNITTTATGSALLFFTIPIASNFASANDLIGSGSGQASSFVIAGADDTNDRGYINIISTGTSAQTVVVNFFYNII